MKLHTGIKDFTCNICHKGFNRYFIILKYSKPWLMKYYCSRLHKLRFSGKVI